MLVPKLITAGPASHQPKQHHQHHQSPRNFFCPLSACIKATAIMLDLAHIPFCHKAGSPLSKSV
ncbi:hypothetical protein EVA_14339 [gut metagenome]|uniref:Uncharacterized protein n=1 Tax=gut metagenome TaxID=749906 RepID=J9FSV0_9ZZZZ